MENTKSERVRIDYFDIAKAIAIFLVIVGHFAPFSIENPYYKLVFYSFHMPLFFFVSGIFVRRHRKSGYGIEHWMEFFRKNIFALLVPYFIWALIFSDFSFKNLPFILYGTDASLEKAGSAPSLWYLPCLFVARVMMELILMSSKKFPKLNRHLYAAGFAVLAFFISFLLPDMKLSYPWGANTAFSGLGFMLSGYASKELLDRLRRGKLMVNIFTFVAFSAILFAGNALQGEKPQFVMMFAGEYGNPLFFFINAFSGTGAVIALSLLLSKLLEKRQDGPVRKFLLWLGQNTMGVFLLHFPIVNGLMGSLLLRAGMNMSSIFTALLAAVITLFICCIIILPVNRYMPELLGRSGK